jgi:hypothetical protein
MIALLWIVGLINIGLSLPIDGPLGVVLAVSGMVCIWRAWAAIIRKSGQARH